MADSRNQFLARSRIDCSYWLNVRQPPTTSFGRLSSMTDYWQIVWVHTARSFSPIESLRLGAPPDQERHAVCSLRGESCAAVDWPYRKKASTHAHAF